MIKFKEDQDHPGHPWLRVLSLFQMLPFQFLAFQLILCVLRRPLCMPCTVARARAATVWREGSVPPVSGRRPGYARHRVRHRPSRPVVPFRRKPRVSWRSRQFWQPRQRYAAPHGSAAAPRRAYRVGFIG